MSHDYIRHGTTTLFAAFDVNSGSVIGAHYRRHRHQEFLRFLKLIDAAVPRTSPPTVDELPTQDTSVVSRY
jgi:hypothetical protein